MISSSQISSESSCISRLAVKLLFILSLGTILPLLALFAYCLVTDTLWVLSNLIWLSIFTSILGMLCSFALLQILFKPLLIALHSLENYLVKDGTDGKASRDCVGEFAHNLQYLLNKISSLSESLRRNANTDPLTGLMNRQASEELLHKEIARAQRDKLHILLVMIDIGNFKRVNEQFGQQIGDVCLTHIAEVLTGSVREGDWVARWAEDQFLIVLWNFNHQHPMDVLSRIQKKSQQTPVGELLQLDVCMGACEFAGNMQVDDLLAHTDAALREAKQKATNHIEIATPYPIQE
ncbi:MAG: GGDEF domain-containing protein [Thiotrichaceae bacterium]|nr:GGDEF domain-containing protein [Thiotrichaceae bacterium]